MDYLIIDGEDLNMVSPVECGDIHAVAREVLTKIKNGRTPRVFVEVPFDVNVKVREDKIGETTKSKAKQHKDPGDTGDSKVRSGDEGAPEKLGEGSGDPLSDSGAED